MSYLLDTHTYLWFLSANKKLPLNVSSEIEDIKKTCFLSIASLWEITIKIQLGKLKLEISLEELFNFAENNKIELLTINTEHLLVLANLTKYHNDPFDRIIISQAISEDLILISNDEEFKNYNVKLMW